MINNLILITYNLYKLNYVRFILGSLYNIININIDLIKLQSISVKKVIKYNFEEAKKI